MNKFIVLKSGNIGNRIKAYVSHLARYETVLSTNVFDTGIFNNILLASDEDLAQYPSTGSVWRLLVDSEEEKYVDEYKTIDFLYNKTPEYFKNKYIPIFKKLQINPQIKEKINKFTCTWDKENMVGISIRSGLPPMEDGHRSKWVDYAGYEKEIESLSINQKCFLTTDNLDILNYFKNKYKDKIIIRDERHKDGYSIGDVYSNNSILIEDSFIDMYLLSQCYHKIIATFGSTYPECAWWFGECKAEVIVPTLWEHVPETFKSDVFTKK